MIQDLFHGHSCCCDNRYTKDTPLTFRRLEAIETRKGLDFLFRCLKSKKTLRLEYIGWGVRS